MLSEALDSAPSREDLMALKKQLNVVQLMCDQAIGMYQRALQLTKQAQGTNRAGMVTNVAFRGVGAMDVMLDAKREKEMQAAIQPAEMASQMLVDGFKKVPDALRLRYPAEMSRVGDVPAAKLRVGGFGRAMVATAAFGSRGAAINDITSAQKIRENEQSIAQCIAIVNEQRQLMNIVQARLDQDIAHTPATSSSTQPQQQQQPVAVVAAPPPPPAISAAPPPAIVPQMVMLQMTAPHIVDENSQAMRDHQIISVPAGARVALKRGDLQNGLGAPYNDYIEVEYNGRVGKVSRLVVAKA